jgi:hypothetical protein
MTANGLRQCGTFRLRSTARKRHRSDEGMAHGPVAGGDSAARHRW